jgi:hypothetical protein
MNDVDLELFKFDYDLTWMGFFLNSENHVYGRYGGRDATSDEGRLSIAGMKTTMRRVLETHRHGGKTSRREVPAKFARDYFDVNPKRCLHCHEIWEGLRQQQFRSGTWTTAALDVYPLPENLGLVLSVDSGTRVVFVVPGTAAAKSGLRIGDEIQVVGSVEVLSEADIQWALHNAPERGSLTVQYERANTLQHARVNLASGWRKTDHRWRKSMSAAADYLK